HRTARAGSVVSPTGRGAVAADRAGRGAPNDDRGPHYGRGAMKLFLMTLRMALHALQRNKLRSALTMLGIVIGVAAVITMVSIGAGAEAVVQQEIVSLGNNLLMVVPGATTASGVRSGWGGRATLTVSGALGIQKECLAVAGGAFTLPPEVQVVSGQPDSADV